MQARGSIVVARPQKAVFEFMDVPENQARISPRLSTVETTGVADTGAKRATYTYRLFGLGFDGEVRGIEHDSPHVISFEMRGDVRGHIRWDFEPIDRGTRVTYSAEYDLGLPAGLTWILGPLIDRFNREEVTRTLENLRDAVEVADVS